MRTVVQRQTDGHGVRIHVDVAGYRAKRRALAEFTRDPRRQGARDRQGPGARADVGERPQGRARHRRRDRRHHDGVGGRGPAPPRGPAPGLTHHRGTGRDAVRDPGRCWTSSKKRVNRASSGPSRGARARPRARPGPGDRRVRWPRSRTPAIELADPPGQVERVLVLGATGPGPRSPSSRASSRTSSSTPGSRSVIANRPGRWVRPGAGPRVGAGPRPPTPW